MTTVAATIDPRTAVRKNIDENSNFDIAYVTMNCLSTVVAGYGLFANSPAVVIGAMIIAMLLGPISGVALGTVDRNDPLLRKGFATLVGGIAVVYGTAFVLGLVHRDIPLTNEILGRTAPNLMDLMIALGGGAAGAYSMISSRLSVAFVGVAIATALVPPLSSSAICLARGEYAMASGAFLLAFTNIVAIQVAGSIVMWLAGFRGAVQHVPGSALKRNLLSVGVLSVLAVLLGVQLRHVIAKEVYEASVRNILKAASAGHKGAYLTGVRFQEVSGKAVVVAVYRTPAPFTPAEVGTIEPKLPPMPGTNSTELRIRSIPVEIASKNGFLYSSDDLKEYGHPE